MLAIPPSEGRWSPRSLRGKSNSPSSRENWKQSFKFATAKSVGHGGSGSVFAIDKDRVIKVFSGDEDGQLDLRRERDIFYRLQLGDEAGMKFIVQFKEEWSSGLVLERLESTLRQRLIKIEPPSPPKFSHALRWSKESCEGLKFLHENGVIHGDFGCQNIMVDIDGHVKICDFAGSKLGEEGAWISYEVRSQHPSFSGQQPTVETEIFALGSVLFEIWTSRPPYASKSNSDVRQNYLAGEFPTLEIKYSRVRDIVAACWAGEYESVEDARSGFDLID